MLEDVLKEIKENKTIAEQDLSAVDPRALPYKKGIVNRAKENLEELYVKYKNEILKRAIFILVTGDSDESFAQTAEEFGCFTLDAKTLFKEITDKLDPQLYLDKNLNASVFDIVGNILEDKMKEMDIVSYNAVIFDQKLQRHVRSKQEMVDVVKDAINLSVGTEVVGLDALERVTKEAVNKEYKSKTVPILLHSKDETFICNLSDYMRKLNPRVVRVAAGKTESANINPLTTVEEITKENVKEALKKVAGNA